MSAMPGMRGADHIGFTVPDLDAAVKFLVEVLGCTEIYELNPDRAEGNWPNPGRGRCTTSVLFAIPC